MQAHDDHTQAQATTRGSRLRETISDPCWIVFIPYRYRTSSHPEPARPGQPSAHQCASVSSTAQLPSSLNVRPVRPASLPCPVCTRQSTSSATSSRLVPCHRPRLLCNLAPIWSCQSIFTALPTPDSVACLLARSLATRQSHTVHSPTPTSPSHCLGGSQDTSNCLGLLAVGPRIQLLVRAIAIDLAAQVDSASLGGPVGARDDGGNVRTQTPSSHRRVATDSS